MNIWVAISLVLAVASVYMLMLEIFSVAFKLTGLATSKIRLQVASLFTGTGFTTAESELVVNDKKRRKIAIACAYTGHIFSVVIMGLVINVFFSIGTLVNSEKETTITFTEWYFIFFYISVGLFLFVLFLKIPQVNKRFLKILESIAISSSKRNRNTNLITVLDMYGKHAIAEVVLNQIPEFMNETPLYKMGLTKSYSINLLSIKRGKRIIDVSKDTMFAKGDTLILYGLINDINEAFINSISDKANVVVVDKSNEINIVGNYGSTTLVEVYIEEVPEELKGIKIKDAKLTDKYSITIGFIKRNDTYMPANKDMIIEKGDTVALFGPYKNIKMLFLNDEKDKENNA